MALALIGAPGCQAAAPTAPALGTGPIASPFGEPALMSLGLSGEIRLPAEISHGYAERVSYAGAGEAELLNAYGQQVFRVSKATPWQGLVPAGHYTLVFRGPAAGALALWRHQESGTLMIQAPNRTPTRGEVDLTANPQVAFAIVMAYETLKPLGLDSEAYRRLMAYFTDLYDGPMFEVLARRLEWTPTVVGWFEAVLEEAPQHRAQVRDAYDYFKSAMTELRVPGLKAL